MSPLTITGLTGIPENKRGADIGAHILKALTKNDITLEKNDCIVIARKNDLVAAILNEPQNVR